MRLVKYRRTEGYQHLHAVRSTCLLINLPYCPLTKGRRRSTNTNNASLLALSALPSPRGPLPAASPRSPVLPTKQLFTSPCKSAGPPVLALAKSLGFLPPLGWPASVVDKQRPAAVFRPTTRTSRSPFLASCIPLMHVAHLRPLLAAPAHSQWWRLHRIGVTSSPARLENPPGSTTARAPFASHPPPLNSQWPPFPQAVIAPSA